MKSHLIDLPYFSDYRGDLAVAEQMKGVPFEIKRAFWTFNVPEGRSRGAHAHKSLRQLLIAISGSFTVNVDDGKEQKGFVLDNPRKALIVEPEEWSSEDFFSSDAVCLVLCNDVYDESDYIRDYNEFLEYIKEKEY
ncbi:MAG: FdtA/QdtA family cupin domain-containing protein [Prevotella sp.]|nr:FdtA/QdtA family cupin domain-containing protein [Prevotella sp.]